MGDENIFVKVVNRVSGSCRKPLYQGLIDQRQIRRREGAMSSPVRSDGLCGSRRDGSVTVAVADNR
jgi:hypothetical protein